MASLKIAIILCICIIQISYAESDPLQDIIASLVGTISGLVVGAKSVLSSLQSEIGTIVRQASESVDSEIDKLAKNSINAIKHAEKLAKNAELDPSSCNASTSTEHIKTIQREAQTAEKTCIENSAVKPNKSVTTSIASLSRTLIYFPLLKQGFSRCFRMNASDQSSCFSKLSNQVSLIAKDPSQVVKIFMTPLEAFASMPEEILTCSGQSTPNLVDKFDEVVQSYENCVTTLWSNRLSSIGSRIS